MSKPQKKITYVTRDIERALGKMPSADYEIITGRTAYSEAIEGEYPSFVHLIDDSNSSHMAMTEASAIDTADLFENGKTIECIARSKASLLVFKNSSRIEAIAREHGWKLLNPPANLAEKIENKVSQAEWLGDLAGHLPPHMVSATKNLRWDEPLWKGEPFVVQWAHGHTGDATVLIDSAEALSALQKKFPDREARASSLLKGPSFTVNAVVGEGETLVGNVSYQLTGLAPFTDNAFSTVGNDWGLTHSILDESEVKRIEDMTMELGDRLRESGWKGLFGADFVKDIAKNWMYLIEINARQPASATFESALQQENRRQGVAGLTVFEAHVKALTGETLDGNSLVIINDGAQVIQRVTKEVRNVPDDSQGSLELAGYKAIPYENTEPNSDLLRVQSGKSIMEAHGGFNGRGKEIIDIISS